MKKVTCIVMYSNNNGFYELKNMTVKHKNNNIPLYALITNTYSHFDYMYSDILKVLKNNNFYVHKWEEFNSEWYDIDFINIDYMTINRYPYKNI